MRPLPRLLAVTDDRIVAAEDFPIRTAAIAAAGPTVGIVVRAPQAPSADQLKLLLRVRALIRPPEAAFLAHGDPALGQASGSHGLELAADGPTPSEARLLFPIGPIGVAIRSLAEAKTAINGGADFLVAGPIFPSGADSAPGHGLEWLSTVAGLGPRVFAIGGIGVEQIGPALLAGAWGVAATSALWHSPDPAKAADRFARELVG